MGFVVAREMPWFSGVLRAGCLIGRRDGGEVCLGLGVVFF